MQLVLKNIMEEYVTLTLDEMLGYLDGCKCERCKLDMISYALNRLEPKYVVTPQGEMMARLCEFDNQFKTSVMSKLIQAHELISKNPRH